MQGSKFKVLIVDDDESNIYLLQECFGDLYNIYIATNAADGLAIVESEFPSVIVSDYRMPLMNGIDLLKAASIISPESVTILMTAYNDHELIVETTSEFSFFHYLQKPIDLAQFEITMKSACNTYSLQEEKKKLQQKIIEVNKTIDEQVRYRTKLWLDKNDAHKDSLIYAQSIQQALFPFPSFFERHFQEHFVLYQPKDIVSGDFYWAYETHDKSQVVIVLGDCTGHGVPGALLSMLGMKAIDSVVHYQEVLNPAEILTSLHNSIRMILKQSQTGNVDGMDAAVIVWDKALSRFKYAGAKMPIVLFRNGNMERIIGNNREIGGVSLSVPRVFSEQEFDIKIGDSIYLFSDGFVDQFGGPQQRKLMSKRFFSWMLEMRELPFPEQKEILWTKMQDWMAAGNEKQLDDILMLGLKF